MRFAIALLAFTSCASAPERTPSDARVQREAPRAERQEERTQPEERAEAAAEPSAGPDDLSARYADREALRVMRGRASYYSDRLAGRSTANGERYDPRAFTAASRTLPFGTVIRVVRADTGATVVVRVNDRGPFGDRGRILDLSRAAAEQLDMIRAGVIDIRAEILEQPE